MKIGPGWELYHLTDRVVELRKDDPIYRAMTGRDGFVKTRVDPTMTREQAVQKAIALAQFNDEKVAKLVAARMMPNARQMAELRAANKRWAFAAGVPGQEPEGKRYKP